MRGRVEVKVSSGNKSFTLILTEKLTVIKGDSGTGKTKLVNFVYGEKAKGGDMWKIVCKYEVMAVSPRRYYSEISNAKDMVVFVDEDIATNSPEFSKVVKESSCYFVIVSREPLFRLSYSLSSVYELDYKDGQYTLSNLYSDKAICNDPYLTGGVMPTAIIHEDRGLFVHKESQQFPDIKETPIDYLLRTLYNCTTYAAGGKSRIVPIVRAHQSGTLCVIADSCGFGCHIDDLLSKAAFMAKRVRVVSYFPYSVEWLLLSAGIFKLSNTQLDKLEHFYDYLDAGSGITLEEYFTKLISEVAKDNFTSYSKTSVSEVIKSKSSLKKVELFLKSNGFSIISINTK